MCWLQCGIGDIRLSFHRCARAIDLQWFIRSTDFGVNRKTTFYHMSSDIACGTPKLLPLNVEFMYVKKCLYTIRVRTDRQQTARHTFVKLNISPFSTKQ